MKAGVREYQPYASCNHMLVYIRKRSLSLSFTSYCRHIFVEMIYQFHSSSSFVTVAVLQLPICRLHPFRTSRCITKRQQPRPMASKHTCPRWAGRRYLVLPHNSMYLQYSAALRLRLLPPSRCLYLPSSTVSSFMNTPTTALATPTATSSSVASPGFA